MNLSYQVFNPNDILEYLKTTTSRRTVLWDHVQLSLGRWFESHSSDSFCLMDHVVLFHLSINIKLHLHENRKTKITEGPSGP